MLLRQNGVCAICGGIETAIYKGKIKDLAVDHDHETGAIRGICCSNCNNGMGCFRDNPTLLEKAIAYLRRHKDFDTFADGGGL